MLLDNMRRYLLLVLMTIPFFSSCINDDCTDCADMAYDTRVVLKIVQPNNNTKSTTDPELDIHNYTLFVFNADSTLNTIKKVAVGDPTLTPFTSTVSLTITSAAKFIYCIANCNDIYNNPTSNIATQISGCSSNLMRLFNTLNVNYNEISENSCLVHAGYTDQIIQDGSNPYNYDATVHIKPIVSKFLIHVNVASAPTDYITCIDSVSAFVLNSRSKVRLFDTINTDFDYLHGGYESFWLNANNNFNITSLNYTQTNNLSKTFTDLSVPLALYVPANNTASTSGNTNKTLVVLKVWFKMTSIDNTTERFCRYFTVQLNPTSPSTLSVARGKLYNINFTLSGKYWGALSPLSSMMVPYSPLPTKGKKDLIYVSQEKYSTVRVSDWK